MRDNPAFKSLVYDVPIARLVGAIMLGVLTYDANLLVIEPPEPPRSGRKAAGLTESGPGGAGGPDAASRTASSNAALSGDGPAAGGAGPGGGR